MIPSFVLKDHFNQFVPEFYKMGGIDKSVKADTILFDANDTTQRVTYYIKKGLAKLSFVKEEGSEHIILLFGKGSMYPINWNDFIFTTERFEVFVAMTDLEVIALPTIATMPLCGTNSEFAVATVKHYERYVSTLLTKILLDTYHDSLIYISTFIYIYYQEEENTFFPTQEQIGQITGFSRVQVARVLAKLRDWGCITTARNKIRIKDINKLENLCSGVIKKAEKRKRWMQK